MCCDSAVYGCHGYRMNTRAFDMGSQSKMPDAKAWVRKAWVTRHPYTARHVVLLESQPITKGRV
jgi:hypothetical protein